MLAVTATPNMPIIFINEFTTKCAFQQIQQSVSSNWRDKLWPIMMDRRDGIITSPFVLESPRERLTGNSFIRECGLDQSNFVQGNSIVTLVNGRQQNGPSAPKAFTGG